VTKPDVSVIIPTYNRAGWLGGAIQSVLDQAGSHKLEVIVIDDGSTDDTGSVVKAFGSKVKYIKIEHSGKPAVARNEALAVAQGRLVAFLDSDDKWLPDKLNNQVPLFDDPEVILTYGNALVMKSDGELTKKKYIPTEELAGGESFKSLLLSNVLPTVTVMARRQALEELGGFNEADGLAAVEDYELWLRVANTYPKGIKSLNKTLAHYRQHDKNISQATQVTALRRIIEVYNQLWRGDLSSKNRPLLEQAIEDLHGLWGKTMDAEYPQEKPIISVIMGIYKDEQHVWEAVQSILDQTYRNLEFIIINDGSPDRSPEIVASFDDLRIRLIHQTNHGLVYTLNKAAKLARGEFIARMDADDISMPSRFEKEMQLLISRAKVGVVGSFFAYIDKANQPTGVVITAPTKHIDIRRSFYINNPFGHGSTIFRKEAYLQAGDYTNDYGPTEDFDMWRRLADDSWQLAIIPEVLYLYRLVASGISAQAGTVQHKFAAKIIAEQFKKPFIYKGFRTIVHDGYFYRTMDSTFAEIVFHQYINEQYVIAMEMLARGWAKSGTITALAAWWLDHSLWRKLLRPVIGGFLRKFNLRPRKA